MIKYIDESTVVIKNKYTIKLDEFKFKNSKGENQNFCIINGITKDLLRNGKIKDEIKDIIKKIPLVKENNDYSYYIITEKKKTYYILIFHLNNNEISYEDLLLVSSKINCIFSEKKDKNSRLDDNTSPEKVKELFRIIYMNIRLDDKTSPEKLKKLFRILDKYNIKISSVDTEKEN